MMATCYSQHDDRWRRLKLGSGHLCIRRVGCLLCAVASAVRDLTGAERIDPGWLNAWLREGGGFYDGTLLIWRALEPLGVRVEQLINCEDIPAPIDRLLDALNKGRAVVVKVDFYLNTPSIEEHWVRVLCSTHGGDDLLIMDPWQQPGNEEVMLLDRYAIQSWDLARAIMGFAVLASAPELRME